MSNNTITWLFIYNVYIYKKTKTMKTQTNKIITMIVCIIVMASSSSMAQKINLNDGYEIDVLRDFLQVKEKIINYEDTNLWVDYDKKREIAFIKMDEDEFYIRFKGVVLYSENDLYSKKFGPQIKKNHSYCIMMNYYEMFFIMDDSGTGGFYRKNSSGNLSMDYIQISEMTQTEMCLFGSKLSKLLDLLR